MCGDITIVKKGIMLGKGYKVVSIQASRYA